MSNNNGNDVITAALANLSDGKNVQVEKVLKLSKAEIMDMIFEECISRAEAESAAAKDAAERVRAAFAQAVKKYVTETFGLGPSSFEEVEDDRLRVNDDGKLSFDIDIHDVLPAGMTPRFGEFVSVECGTPAWINDLWEEWKRLFNLGEAMRMKFCLLPLTKSQFKSAVIKSLLSEHEEGRALLEKVKEISARLVS